MKLPASAHTDRPWRIHAIAPDFELEDVWALPTPGGPDDLPRLVEQFATPTDGPVGTDARPGEHDPLALASRALFALRWKLGELFGWDREGDGLGARVPTLRDRLPDDLRALPDPELPASLPFRSVYLTHDEYAAEIANRTVHGILHLGWVPDGAGGYHAQMAVLVKPNGLAGAAYMAAIRPFRLLIVYPVLLRRVGREWAAAA